MLKRIAQTAGFAGLLAALLLTLMQSLWVTPLILEAETYESAAPVAEHSHAANTAHDHHDADAWAPQDGAQRTLFTGLSNLVVAVGFALMLAGLYSLRAPGRIWQGLLWGLAGFAIFSLAPAIGLPPELPGTAAADLTLGANFDDGRGNAVLSLGYQNQKEVYFGGDRPFSTVTLESYDEFFVAGQGSSTASPSALDIGGGRSRRQITADGTNISPFYSAFNFNPYNVFQTPFKRFNIFAQGNYEISDAVEVYTRGMFSKNTVDTIIAPSGSFGGTVTINLNNPYLPATLRNQFCAQNVGAAGGLTGGGLDGILSSVGLDSGALGAITRDDRLDRLHPFLGFGGVEVAVEFGVGGLAHVRSVRAAPAGPRIQGN